MSNFKKMVKTIRMSPTTNEKFETAFENSNADSKGEYLDSILEQVLNYKPTTEIQEVEVEVEKKLESNQILVSLTPAQMFALKEHISAVPDYAEKQNEIIDLLSEGKPLFSFSKLYEPEFQELWVRNIVLTEEMSEAEMEAAIKHNISAYLLNMFFTNLIDENIPDLHVDTSDIKAFIKKRMENATK
ncbi:hypothetical protein N9164_07325 [Draconibacterium sp.]|nr:hypothetical protein [Draconibacterium sp.]